MTADRWEGPTPDDLRASSAAMAMLDAHNEGQDRLARALEREMVRPGHDILPLLGADPAAFHDRYGRGGWWPWMAARGLGD